MTKRIGEILISNQIISKAQLEEGLRTQLTWGCRIGTVLVQLGFAKLEEVGRALSTQHGVPHAAQASLENVSPEALAAIPVELCLRHKVVPFRVEGKILHLAMLDPLRKIAGEFSYATGFSIVRYATPELRLRYLLEKHFGETRDPRFLRLPVAPREERERRTYIAPTIAQETTAASSIHKGSLAAVDQDSLVYLDDYEKTAQPEMGDDDLEISIEIDEGQPIAAFRKVDVIAEQLEVAVRGDDIARLLVSPLWENVSLSLLFWVRDKYLVGCWAHGATISFPKLQKLVISLDTSSIFQAALDMSSIVRGHADHDPLQAKIAQFVGAREPGQVCVAPIILRHKTVNLLCVQSFRDEVFPETALQELRLVVEKSARAYFRLLERIKR